MSKRTIFLFIILLCILAYVIINVAPNGHTFEILGNDQTVSDLPFKKGERLTYEVRYKGAKIGKSVLMFHGEEVLDDSQVYYITFSTRVPSFNDAEEIYADKDTFLPVKVNRSIKKTIGFNDRIVERYDQKNFRVDISSKSKLRSKNFSIKKDSPIHNAILLAYYCRVKDSFKQGERFKITLPTVDFEVIFSGTETVDTPLGEFKSYLFTSEPDKFKLWLSTDEKRTPLKIENPSALGYSLIIRSID